MLNRDATVSAPNKDDATFAMERGLIGLSAIPHGGIDILRLVRVSAGALCELALDAVADPAAFWQSEIESLWSDIGLDNTDREIALERQEQRCDTILRPADPGVTDREVESGRSLLRSIQMEHGVPSEVLNRPLRAMMAQVVLASAATSPDRAAIMLYIEKVTQDAIAYELATQELCDLLIETKIADHDWSIGDAICALAGAAAHRLAIKKAALNWRWEDSYQVIADVMMREALSLGVPASTGWEFGMAANDSRPNPPTALIHAIETSCIVFLDLISITAFETQAVVLAKAAGRMLALAATGSDPEIEAHIAKPLACHAMAETLRSFV